MNSRAFVLLSLLPGTAAFQYAPASLNTFRSVPNNAALKSSSDLNLAPDNNCSEDNDVASRRSFCARSIATIAGASMFSTASNPAFAAESNTKMEPYDDADYGFRLQIPSSWENTVQKLSGRRKAVFFTDPSSKDASTGAIDTLGFVAYTPVRDDFTTLGSFGSVDEVAQSTILPKGELAGLDDASKMLSAVSKNNAYYFDYVATPVVPTESGKAMTKTLKPVHFRTIFTLLPLKNSAGMTLVTITLQTTEERYGDVKGVFDDVVNSYGKA